MYHIFYENVSLSDDLDSECSQISYADSEALVQ
jgi:hypothetical protein